jgi:tRNA modification GTPase
LGPAGVSIIRISGQDSWDIASKLFKINLHDFEPRKAFLAWVYDRYEEKIDQALVLTFKAPKSFTGEDSVELHLHGGVFLSRKVLEIILESGAVLAKAGEFSERAFLNGKLDLSQAEGILDLIQARTKLAGKNAAKLYEGFLGKKIKEFRTKLIELESEILAGIDFPDEVLEKSPDEFTNQIKVLVSEMDEILFSEREGHILREGYKIAIVGKPNVGKSSLLNTLLKSERAIVTEIAGTTRDILEESFSLEGLPIVLLDTAGLRETKDLVEQIGIERTRKALVEADLLLELLDLNECLKNPNDNLDLNLENPNQIKIGTKLDLLLDANLNFKDSTQETLIKKLDFHLLISSVKNINIDELKKLLIQKITADFSGVECKINHRQADLLRKSREALLRCLESVNLNFAQDFWTIDLKLAIQSLGEITGDVITEEILDEVFSRFCIGK